MPAERRQVVSRTISPANGASVRPSRRRTTALPSATATAATVENAVTATPTSSVDFGRRNRSSAAFARGLDNNDAAGNSPAPAHAHAHAHTHTRNFSSSGFGGTGATTNPSAVHHRSRPSISRAARPQSVYQIVEAYRPLAYSIEKAEQEAKVAAAAAEKRRSLVLSPLQTTMTTTTTTAMMQQVSLAEDDAMDIDEFGQFSPATPTTTPPPVTPSSHNQFEDDDFAVLRSPTRGKQQEECISGRGMLKRGYHIILDTPLENSEEARWAAIKRMEAQLRELDKSFTRVAPPSRRRMTNVTNHASTAAPSPASFSAAANRAAWNI